MKLLITGSRNGHPYVECAIDAFIAEFDIPEEFILGCANGVDAQANAFCYRRGYNKAIFVANWRKYGNDAGKRRNERMVQDCEGGGDDMFLAFPSGESRGTKHCMTLALFHGMEGWSVNTTGQFFVLWKKTNNHCTVLTRKTNVFVL